MAVSGVTVRTQAGCDEIMYLECLQKKGSALVNLTFTIQRSRPSIISAFAVYLSASAFASSSPRVFQFEEVSGT